MLTTDDAYPKIFPVNSIHANAPRWQRDFETRVAIEAKGSGSHGSGVIFHSGKLAQLSCRGECLGHDRTEIKRPHDKRPTPSPLITRPTTMVLNPVVKVCTAPPMPKITAPANKVPLLPKISPICPAAMEVTCEMDQITAKKELIAELTESTNFEHCDHSTNL